MNIREKCLSVCQSYWNAPKVLRNFRDNDFLTNCKAGAVALTYFSGIVPLSVLVVQKISLIGRVKAQSNVSDQGRDILISLPLRPLSNYQNEPLEFDQGQNVLNSPPLNPLNDYLELLQAAEQQFADEPLKDEILHDIKRSLEPIKSGRTEICIDSPYRRIYDLNNAKDIRDKEIEEKAESFFDHELLSRKGIEVFILE